MVRAHKRYMQSKKNKFCIQYGKPRQKLLFYRQFLIGYSFANCTECISFFVGYIMVKNENYHLLLCHCRYFDKCFTEMFLE